MTLHFVEPRIERPKLIEPVINLGATIRPDALPKRWMMMSPADAHADALPFSLNVNASANATQRDNIIHRMGWNITTDGAQEDETEPALSIEFEELWETGGNNKGEFHWNFIDTDGASRRVFSSSWNRGDMAASLEAQICARVFYLVDAVDGSTFRMKGNFAGSNSQILFQLTQGIQISGVGASNSMIYFAQNNRSALLQAKASSGATVLAMCDENDKILIGAAESWAEAAGVVLGSSRIAFNFSDTDKVTAVVGTTNGLCIGGAAGQKIGFHGATPVAQQTITGSRGANAALASLCTALASLGLIVDGTS